MKHRSKNRKLGSKNLKREALLKSLAGNLILFGRIRTTETRAKELSRFIEPLITKAKSQSLSARRELVRYFSPKIARQLFKEIAPNYKERRGGYTRVIKLEPRKTDGARLALVELIEERIAPKGVVQETNKIAKK